MPPGEKWHLHSLASGANISAMKLADYLAANGLSYSAFADKIGRNVSTVSRIAREETLPDWRTMEQIERATDGAVTPNDFRRSAA